ncbi:MAG: hypothetical protein PHT51_00645 [Patescibacteria group bacterium]|nr:hypothetical protein [Patescibacteria group bacterium]MDD4610722.1 hypothetical protein [Patescibacteria group bacterium]
MKIIKKILIFLEELKKNKYLYFFLLFSLTAFIHAYNFFDSDEGAILAGSWEMINNKIPYTDFFAFIAPGSFYLIFWLWKIFGAKYLIAKTAAIIIIFFSAIGIFKINELIKKSYLNLLPPLIFVILSVNSPIINHNYFAILPSIWSVYFFLLALKKNNYYFMISGFLSGLTVLFLQHKGLILIAALFSFLVLLSILKKKFYAKAMLTFLLFSILPLLILLKWPLKLLYYNLIIFPYFNYWETNKLPLTLFLFFFIFYLIIILLLKKEKNEQIWTLLYLQFFLLISSLTRPDIYHLILSIFPLLCLLPLAILIALNSNDLNNIHLKILLFFLAISMSLYCVASSFITFFYYQIGNYRLIEYIKTNCQESPYIYAGPFMPEYYFETKKLNPTPYSFLITRQNSEEQFAEAKKYLEKFKPACALLNYELVEKFGYNKNNPVDKYLEENYKIIKNFGNPIVYKIK